MVGDGVEDTAHADGRVVDIDEVDLFFFDIFGEGSDGSGFTGADFSCDEGYSSAFEQPLQALEELFELFGKEETFGGHLFGEGFCEESEIGIEVIHVLSPFV